MQPTITVEEPIEPQDGDVLLDPLGKKAYIYKDGEWTQVW